MYPFNNFEVLDDWLNSKHPDFELSTISKKINLKEDYVIGCLTPDGKGLDDKPQKIKRLDKSESKLEVFISQLSSRLNAIETSPEMPSGFVTDINEALYIVRDMYFEYTKFNHLSSLTYFQNRLAKVERCLEKVSNDKPYLSHIKDVSADKEKAEFLIGLHFSFNKAVIYELRIYQKLFNFLIMDLGAGVQNESKTDKPKSTIFRYAYYDTDKGKEALKECYQYLKKYIDTDKTTLKMFKNSFSGEPIETNRIRANAFKILIF